MQNPVLVSTNGRKYSSIEAIVRRITKRIQQVLSVTGWRKLSLLGRLTTEDGHNSAPLTHHKRDAYKREQTQRTVWWTWNAGKTWDQLLTNWVGSWMPCEQKRRRRDRRVLSPRPSLPVWPAAPSYVSSIVCRTHAPTPTPRPHSFMCGELFLLLFNTTRSDVCYNWNTIVVRTFPNVTLWFLPPYYFCCQC